MAVYFRFLKDKVWAMLAYVLSTVALLEMYVATFPKFSAVEQLKISALLAAFPKDIWALLGIDASALNLTKISSFIAMEQYNIIWPIILIVLGISLANWVVAAEVENGTIEQMLALPLSRWKVFTGRSLAGLTMLAIFVFSTVYAIYPLAKLHHVDVTSLNSWPLALSGLLFGITIFCIGLLSSSLFSDKGTATFLSAGIVIALYGMNVLAGLSTSLEYLSQYSVFHYFSSSVNLVSGQFVENYLIYFGVVSVVFAFLAFTRYWLRDTSV